MASCGEYKTMIQLYADDELTGSDRQELLSHLETCADCRREMEELKEFSGQIRKARPQITTPVALRARILKLTAEQQKQEKKKALETEAIAEQAVIPFISRPASTRQPMARRRWFPAAIAALLCIGAGLSFSIPHLRREANSRSFIDTAIVTHRGLTNASMSLDVKSDSPQTVSAWFSNRVQFPFRMPNAGIASDDTAKYKLLGGRLTTFQGEQAALLAFQMPNETITILIASGKKAGARDGKLTYSDGIGFHSMDRDDLHVVTWENKGLVYALTFPGAMANGSNKRTCSTCHEQAAPNATAMLDNPH